MLGRSWVEIDLDRIAENYRIYESRLASGQEIMAVMKADAYGHGDCVVAKLLQEDCGCKSFAVSNIEEAAGLRRAGITGQILILGYTPASCIDSLLEYDISQALLSEEYAELLWQAGGSRACRLKTQFAVDTGMNRIGLNADCPESCAGIIRKYAERFDMTGLFTHICAADDPSENAFTKEQIDKFRALTLQLKDLELPYIHYMNSAAGLWHNEDLAGAACAAVRLGIVLYGLKPDDANTLPEGIKPVLEWKSVISMVKEVCAGESIGYGRSFKAERDMMIATIPTGYADGYSRTLSNRGFVVIAGRRCPIVGRVCMDQLMADVTEISALTERGELPTEALAIGSELSLLSDDFTADDMAHIIGAISYEIVCGISKRVPRKYLKKDGKT